MKKLLWLFFLVILAGKPVLAEDGEEPWIHMPQGAKPSYMGIHGGTMPVSLLVSSDGSSLFTFVGQTGDDFMEVLRKAKKPLPSFGNSTSSYMPARRDTGLFAGNATETIPVFSLPGSAYLRPGISQHLQPFGLSDEPSAIEGDVERPRIAPLTRSFRFFRLPEYLKPKRGPNK